MIPELLASEVKKQRYNSPFRKGPVEVGQSIAKLAMRMEMVLKKTGVERWGTRERDKGI